VRKKGFHLAKDVYRLESAENKMRYAVENLQAKMNLLEETNGSGGIVLG
jgi:hypothetical protein